MYLSTFAAGFQLKNWITQQEEVFSRIPSCCEAARKYRSRWKPVRTNLNKHWQEFVFAENGKKVLFCFEWMNDSEQKDSLEARDKRQINGRVRQKLNSRSDSMKNLLVCIYKPTIECINQSFIQSHEDLGGHCAFYACKQHKEIVDLPKCFFCHGYKL